MYIFRPVALVEITAALAPGGLSGYGGPSLPPSGLKLCLMSLRISCFLPPLYAKGPPPPSGGGGGDICPWRKFEEILF